MKTEIQKSKITITAMQFIQERGDWQVDYEDRRSGVSRGRRYIELEAGPLATEDDIKDFMVAEYNQHQESEAARIEAEEAEAAAEKEEAK